MRFEPGVSYEIRYGLIEGNVLFPDHALVVNRMVIICYDVALFAAHQQLSIPHCLLPVLFTLGIPSCLYSARRHYVTWT